MFDSIASFIAAHQILFGGLISIVAAIAVLSRASARFWVRDFWVRFPLFGYLARLSKDYTVDEEKGCMHAETKLCAIYTPYVTLLPKNQFNERIEYIRKAGDLGRTPIPGWVIGLIALLVIAEGLGFSYMLGRWVTDEGTANIYTLLMFAIVFVLATILVVMTHAAGHQYYRTSLLRSCFQQWEIGKKNHEIKTVALKDPQSCDGHAPGYLQVLNRVAKNPGDRGSYTAVIIAIILIAVIAVFSTVMRWKHLEGQLNNETTVQQLEAAAGNPFDKLALPGDVTAPQRAADQKAKSEEIASTKAEGLSAFVMLGFIFVITQIVGMGAGHKYGFAGKESHNAYSDTGGFSTYDAYWRVREPLVALADARLKHLQQKLAEGAPTKIVFTKTFHHYMKEQQIQSDIVINGSDAPQVAADSPPPTAAPVAAAIAVPATASIAAEISAVEKAKAEIAAISDINAQREHYANLPEDVQDALEPWLRQRNEEKMARKARHKDLFTS